MDKEQRLKPEQSYYRWLKIYGDMSVKGFPSVKVDQARNYKDLELENIRLKKLEADLSLRKVMLKEVIKGNF
jgi:hypothetical protein